MTCVVVNLIIVVSFLVISAQGDDSVETILATNRAIDESDKKFDTLFNNIKEIISFISEFLKNSSGFCNNILFNSFFPTNPSFTVCLTSTKMIYLFLASKGCSTKQNILSVVINKLIKLIVVKFVDKEKEKLEILTLSEIPILSYSFTDKIK